MIFLAGSFSGASRRHLLHELLQHLLLEGLQVILLDLVLGILYGNGLHELQAVLLGLLRVSLLQFQLYQPNQAGYMDIASANASSRLCIWYLM